MRVLYVIDSLGVGGAEISLASIAPELIAGGLRMDVAILRERPGVHEQLRAAGADLFDVEGDGGRRGAIRRLYRLARQRRPDLVHTTLFEADVAGRIAGRLAGVRVVSSLVSEGYGQAHLDDPHLRRWRVRAAQAVDAATARLVHRFHVPASHIADTMARRLRVARGRFDVVPRGRDAAALGRRSAERGAAIRSALGIAPDAPLLLSVARQEYAKGLDVLLEALPMVQSSQPGATLVLAGPPGPESARLRASAARYELTDLVRFLGTRDDVPDLLAAADVFALPSRREGFPGALLEAMALEAPIVATDLAAVREVVGADGIARVVPVEDPPALGTAISATLDDPAGAAAAAARGRQRFLERFTIERVARAMLGFYERASGARASSSAEGAPRDDLGRSRPSGAGSNRR